MGRDITIPNFTGGKRYFQIFSGFAENSRIEAHDTK